jgi:hypothetical protein
MGGDDLGSDDECLMASGQSDASDHSEVEDQVAADNSNKRKSAVETQTKKKKSKTTSESTGVATIAEQTTQQQATFISSAVEKYMSKLDQQPLSQRFDFKAAHFATSKKESLLLRILDIVAQHKMRKWKHKLSPCIVSPVYRVNTCDASGSPLLTSVFYPDCRLCFSSTSSGST